MRKFGQSPLVMLVLFMLVVMAGCKDDSLQPQLDDGIVGHVTDSSGNPVSGAAIGLVFTTQAPDPFAKPATLIRVVVPEPGHLKVRILDATDQIFRTLTDDVVPTGEYTIAWDTRNPAGDLAPNGLYHMVVELNQQEIARASTLLSSVDVETIFERANATTDAEGYFRIPRAFVPTGTMLPVYIDNALVNQAISAEVTVEVARISGQSTTYVQRVITLPSSWERYSVDITLP